MAYQKLTPIIATGATTPRYLGDRFADFVNVLDFGAAGDGVTDDAAAFSAAVTAGSGRPVLVPAGTYMLSEDVNGVFYSMGDVTITGAGEAQVINIVNADTAVHLTGNESISGEKSFAQPLRVRNDAYDFSTTPSSKVDSYVYFTDKNDVEFGNVNCGVDTDKLVIAGLNAINPNASDNTKAALWLHLTTGGTRRAGCTADMFRPTGGIYPTLGQSGNYRWGQLYSTSSSISTSDERQKQDISGIPDAVLDAWGEVGFLQYRMRDAAAKKGTEARLHTGLVAQRIKSVFDAAGLSAADYGFFCHDEWDASPAEGEDPAVEAGDEYSLRYEEALCMEAAYQRRRADRLEARLAELEEQVAQINGATNE